MALLEEHSFGLLLELDEFGGESHIPDAFARLLVDSLFAFQCPIPDVAPTPRKAQELMLLLGGRFQSELVTSGDNHGLTTLLYVRAGKQESMRKSFFESVNVEAAFVLKSSEGKEYLGYAPKVRPLHSTKSARE